MNNSKIEANAVNSSSVSPTDRKKKPNPFFEGLGEPVGRKPKPMGVRWTGMSAETPKKGVLGEGTIYTRAHRLAKSLVGVSAEDRRLIWQAAVAGATIDLDLEPNKELLRQYVRKITREARNQTYAGEGTHDWSTGT